MLNARDCASTSSPPRCPGAPERDLESATTAIPDDNWPLHVHDTLDTATMSPASPDGKRKAADEPISPPPIKRKVQSGTTSRLNLMISPRP